MHTCAERNLHAEPLEECTRICPSEWGKGEDEASGLDFLLFAELVIVTQ